VRAPLRGLVLGRLARNVERLVEQFQHLLARDLFEDVGDRAPLVHRLHRFHIPARRDHDHRRQRIQFQQSRNQIVPAGHGHRRIAQDHLRLVLPVKRQALLARRGLPDRGHSERFQELTLQGDGIRVFVDDQGRLRAGHAKD